MNTFSKWVFRLGFFFGGAAQALTTFPAGSCSLEGNLLRDPGSQLWVFAVNPRTNSETRFILGREIPGKGLLDAGQLVRVEIELSKTVRSAQVEAKLKKIEKTLNPYRVPTTYLTDEAAKRACSAR